MVVNPKPMAFIFLILIPQIYFSFHIRPFNFNVGTGFKISNLNTDFLRPCKVLLVKTANLPHQVGFATRTYGDDECTSPKIKWTGCPRTRSCDACFSIEFDDAKKGSDIMCMNKSPNTECIWTGNLINDSSFVAVTGSNGKCRPFGNDPLEVS